jgi:hypothetical protein
MTEPSPPNNTMHHTTTTPYTRHQAFAFDATGPEGSSARKIIVHNALWRFELTLPGLVEQRSVSDLMWCGVMWLACV